MSAIGELVWTVIALLAGGLFSGAIGVLAWERVWLWRLMSTDRFVVDFRRSLRRLDPAMPILLIICVLCSIGLANEADGASRSLLLAALAFQLIILLGSVALAKPINSSFRRLPEGVAPADVERLRTRWRRLHLCRAALALTPFACLVVAVSQL